MIYDLIVIGGGPGGYAAAAEASKKGLDTALIERDRLGGTCLQRGCVPTKAYLHAAYEGIDKTEMLNHKNEIVDTLTDGIAQMLRTAKVTVYQGNGMLMNTQPPFAVEVKLADDEIEEIQGHRILIATGSKPARIPVTGCDDPEVWTSDDLLHENGSKPFDSLVIIGGGVIGVEMACIYAKIGVAVTIVEAEKNCLPMMDKELSRSAEGLLRGMGVTLLTSTRLTGIAKNDHGFLVTAQKNGEQEIICDRVLLATGRRAQTSGLFAQGAEIAMERGTIVVDRDFQTNVKGIYAIGDVNGIYQLAHVAHAQGLAAVAHMRGRRVPVDTQLIPSCVYTTPEIASVGITQDEAKAHGTEIVVGKALTTQNARSMIENLGRGFIKLIFEKDTGILLGAQLFCGRATDFLGELTLAISLKLTGKQLLGTMRAHPTFYEAVGEAVEKALGKK
ncbi:MAG: dihydrolipoyl dehydrogenase [Clostridiales bacterium]|nr:dihydrolipoyl dehydrogenase [Clostridiales bacterium]